MNEEAIKNIRHMLADMAAQYRTFWGGALLDYIKFIDENSDEEGIKTEEVKLKDNVEYYKTYAKLFLYFANQLEESNKDTTIQAAEELAK